MDLSAKPYDFFKNTVAQSETNFKTAGSKRYCSMVIDSYHLMHVIKIRPSKINNLYLIPSVPIFSPVRIHFMHCC